MESMFRDSGISSEICDQADHDAKNKPRSPRPGNGSGALSFALTRTPHEFQASEGEKTMLMIWTDGGCYPNPGPGGWGFVRSDGFESFGGAARTTNNQMEMTAIIEAMKSVPDGGEVTIFADSQYCINGLTIWKAGWVRKNWMKKGEPMPNRQHWLDLHFQQQRIKSNFKWVRGHSGNAGNERADKLATMGRITMA